MRSRAASLTEAQQEAVLFQFSRKPQFLTAGMGVTTDLQLFDEDAAAEEKAVRMGRMCGLLQFIRRRLFVNRDCKVTNFF